jgi:hypothetical protein
VALFLVNGLTGPTCILLLPFAVAYYLYRRYRWTLWQIAMLGGTAIVQGFEILVTRGGERAGAPLGASLPLLVRIVGGQVFWGALVGENLAAARRGILFNSLCFAAGCVLLVYVLRIGNLAMRSFLLFALTMLAAALASPYIPGALPRWQSLIRDLGSRYWFLPMLAVLWGLLWCVARSTSFVARGVAALALLLATYGMWRDWPYPRFQDRQFRAYVERFQQSPAGTRMEIPIEPDGRKMEITRK